MNGWTRFFLVLLRLALGWLFLFEGIEKVESRWDGKGKPFSSEGYLREAHGPLAPVIKGQIGDPDAEALALVTAQPPNANNDLAQRVPAPLAAEWDSYYQQFQAHYGLDAAQEKETKTIFDTEKKKLGEWLVSGVKEVERPLGNSMTKYKLTTPARVEEYQQKLKQQQEVLEKELPAFGKDVKKERLTLLKADARKLRTELLADIDDQTAKMKEALASKLTADQKAKGPPEIVVEQSVGKSRLELADGIVTYGVFAIGACLLAGMFTRTACVGGAVFLLMLYLAMPPIPGMPDPTRVEGHYYYVSKNLILMLGLLTLATTRSGKWFGVDGLLQFFMPGGRKPETLIVEKPAQARRLPQRVHT